MRMVLKLLPQKEFIKIYNKVPKLCVDVIVQTPKGIVLTKRSIEPWKGQWHIPGGTVLLGETLKQAVKRVAKDELNLGVEITKTIGAIEYFHKRGGYKHGVTVVFLTKITAGNLKVNHQATEIKTFNKIPKNLISEQRKFLEENPFVFYQ